MKLVYGDSRCLVCNKVIYSTDDVLVAEAWPGVEELHNFRSGCYHYDCFQKLDHAEAYYPLKATAQYRQVTAPAWRLLAEDQRVAVAWNRMLKECRVVFRLRARQITLVGIGELQEFSLLIQSFLPDRSQTASGSRFNLERTDDGWMLSVLEPVTASLVLDPADYERLTRHLGRTGESMVGMNLALGEVCRKLEILPRSAACPLAQATGAIIGIDQFSPTDPATLRLVLRKRSKVHLTRDDLSSLQAILPIAAGDPSINPQPGLL